MGLPALVISVSTSWNGFFAVSRRVSLLRLSSHLSPAVPPAIWLGFHPSASSLRPGSLATPGSLSVASETDRRAISPSERFHSEWRLPHKQTSGHADAVARSRAFRNSDRLESGCYLENPRWKIESPPFSLRLACWCSLLSWLQPKYRSTFLVPLASSTAMG